MRRLGLFALFLFAASVPLALVWQLAELVHQVDRARRLREAFPPATPASPERELPRHWRRAPAATLCSEQTSILRHETRFRPPG